MTQTQFAALIGVTQFTVSAVLSGKRRPGPRVVKGLLRAFPERRGEILAVFYREAIIDAPVPSEPAGEESEND